MFVRRVDLPPDPFAVAARLATRPGLAMLVSDARAALYASDARFDFVAVSPVATSDAFVPEPSDPTRAIGWNGSPAAPEWFGVVPYEAFRSLERHSDLRGLSEPRWRSPAWSRYDAVVRIERATGVVTLEGDDVDAVGRLHDALHAHAAVGADGDFVLRPRPRSAADDDAHAARVRRVLEFVAAGDVYQVNVARAFRFDWEGDPRKAFARMFRRAPAPYGFYAEFPDDVVLGTSPELALSVNGDELRSSPIKGTRPRGADAASDAAFSAELDASPKERAELTMAVDLHRNDLGRVAEPGSVRVCGEPVLTRGRTVTSRVADVVARRRPGASRSDVVRAMLPCGSVTGAPKVRAMEIIAELEDFRRGLYTGAMGALGRDGRLTLAMAIRTLELHVAEGHDRTRAKSGAPSVTRGEGVYAAGGGIVADSDPRMETEETFWKAAQVFALCGDH
ncbi:MAG: anthranilate synthase component I family protein [Polyangiaceae bacterium]